MKKVTKRSVIAILVVFAAGMFATSARAQTSAGFEIQIPFDFVVKNRTYEAGAYRVARLNAGSPDTLLLKTVDGKRSMIVMTQRRDAGAPTGISTLTFSRLGKVHFLESIRSSGQNYESQIPSLQPKQRRDNGELIAEVVRISAR